MFITVTLCPHSKLLFHFHQPNSITAACICFPFGRKCEILLLCQQTRRYFLHDWLYIDTQRVHRIALLFLHHCSGSGSPCSRIPSKFYLRGLYANNIMQLENYNSREWFEIHICNYNCTILDWCQSWIILVANP